MIKDIFQPVTLQPARITLIVYGTGLTFYLRKKTNWYITVDIVHCPVYIVICKQYLHKKSGYSM